MISRRTPTALRIAGWNGEPHRRWLPMVAATLSAVMVACGEGGAPVPQSACGSSQAAIDYGCGPTAGGNISYQPGVVLVPGGPDAVRSVSSDGLVWTIKGDAAAGVQVGKVMFVTGRGVGRVLAVRPSGGDVQVVLGPANITDVIKDGSLSSSQPISFDKFSAYYAPDLPGSIAATASASPSPSPARNAISFPMIELTAASGSGVMPPPSNTPPTASAGDFRIMPFCCSGGIGAHVTYSADGLEFAGTVSVHFSTPTITFRLVISGGQVQTADLEVQGGVGIAVDFKAASTSGLAGNTNRTVQVPVDLSVPIFGLPVPMSAHLTQWFILQTGFSAKNSTLMASGDYSFGGSLGFGYANGSFGVHTPEGFAVSKSLVDSISGVSVGVNGLVLAHQARFAVGIGAFGFTAGLQVFLTTSIGVTNGATEALVQCHSATLDMTVKAGIGYTIPQPVADLVNFFLRVFSAPPIAATGGVFSSPQTVVHMAQGVPDVKGCQVS